MKAKIIKPSGFTNPPEWYDSQIGNTFDVLCTLGEHTLRIDLPQDLYMALGQFQYYVPKSHCEMIAE